MESATAAGGAWREVDLEGTDPWAVKKQGGDRLKLWHRSCFREPLLDLMACREVMKDDEVIARRANHLKTVVQVALSASREGELLGASFRLRRDMPTPELSDGTLELPPFSAARAELDASLLEAGCSPALARELREDQKEALQVLLQRESQPASQDVEMTAYFHVPSEDLVQVGHSVCLKPVASLKNLYSTADFARLRSLSVSECLQVLLSPGQITHIYPALKQAVIEWDLGQRKFRATVKVSLLRPCPSSRRAVAAGSTVALREEDRCFCIGREDVGVLLKVEADVATVLFPQCHRWRGPVASLVSCDKPFQFCLELRLLVRYPLRGSICAQEMGWGKTALAIALLQHSYQETMKVYGVRERSLVVVPPKVFGQWQAEMVSWLGLRLPPKSSFYETADGAMKLFFCLDGRQAKQLCRAGAPEASVVLLPSSIFSSKSLGGAFETWLLETPWTRLVLDEAHEVSGLPDAAQSALLRLRPRATHLLTGTPQQGPGALGTARLALLMGVSLALEESASSLSFRWSADGLTNRTARDFLRATALHQECPFKLPVEERLVRVQLSRAEAVIYENCRSHQERPTPTRQLLELCSHFTQEGGATAHQEIAVLIEQKSHALQFHRSWSRKHLALIVFLARGQREVPELRKRLEGVSCPPREARKEAWEEGRKDARACVEELLTLSMAEVLCELPRKPEDVRGAATQAFLKELSKRFPEGEGQEATTRHLLAPWIVGFEEADEAPIFASRKPVEDIFRMHLNSYLAADFVDVGTAKRSLDFLTRSLQELRESGGSCPVCLDELQNGEATCMPSCGHSFHEACLAGSVRVRSACPTCRQEISGIYRAREADPWPKYGTKIKTVVETLQKIREDFPGERVLVYVQFKNMRQKLELAFKEFRVPFLTLEGSARAQGSAIERWQSASDASDFVMMLSCEEHNSGITLTRARHLMMLHPFHAETTEEALDMERQALGRINRIGQTAASVIVWRVVTSETVEEQIYSELRRAASSTGASRKRPREAEE
jgi:SNF2-related domain/Ring finger domain